MRVLALNSSPRGASLFNLCGYLRRRWFGQTEPVADRCTFATIGNLDWETCIGEGGTSRAAQGVASGPDVTIEAPFEVWMDIMTRKADGQQMLMEGRYRVEGDLLLMMKLFERRD
jgi:predicted lipid carrier protein YhbT